MTHQHVSRTNQQSKSDTPLVSGILQRAAVRNVPENEVEPIEVEATTFRESRFHHNFCQVPVSTETASVIQAKGLMQEQVHKENKTGLPDNLKEGIENLSGMAMDDVKVHYNSSKPSQIQALAYTQGTDIHVASGQEQHLPHEAWHIVQQAQGRVKPTIQIKEGVSVNDNKGLEHEADVMGAKALQTGITYRSEHSLSASRNEHQNNTTDKGSMLSESTSSPVQRVMTGVPPFEIYTPATLSPAALARLHSVVNTLVTTLQSNPNITVQFLIVSVEQEGGNDYDGNQSTIEGDNPAQTITIPHGVHPSDIQITVQRPFAEAATEGEMLGLLAHEIGVHNIPSDFIGINDSAANVFTPIHTPGKTAKNNTPSGGYEFQNWPAPVPGQDSSWHGNRQHDHVMVADILRNPPPGGGPVPLTTRANVYFQTVLNIGDTIWADVTKPLPERQTQTTELVHLYLVDIARIIASDDGRIPPAYEGLAINDVYGELFNRVVFPQRGAHQWIPAARPKANAFTLGISLATFIAKVKLEKTIRG